MNSQGIILKHYIILAESLYYELKGEGFDVLACVTGATATPGYNASLPQGKGKTRSVMSPNTVVDAALSSLDRKTN
ncbi:MAG: hypothetical protein DRI97_07915 [Bacteroidetes bacterium]|nr:MAG: hypothetical protein DRI97_07915 [Bacteroidota bacterium]RLE02221.1 MAG: hypothetical protein DRJ13_05845 [Bacteroidota bacterium]